MANLQQFERHFLEPIHKLGGETTSWKQISATEGEKKLSRNRIENVLDILRKLSHSYKGPLHLILFGCHHAKEFPITGHNFVVRR